MDDALTERIAEAIHDGWWETMVEDGYTLGPRDDTRRTHPHLRPWRELPDENNEQDRSQARKVLALLRTNAITSAADIARAIHDSWVQYVVVSGHEDHPHAHQAWDEDARGKREHLRQAAKVLEVWQAQGAER